MKQTRRCPVCWQTILPTTKATIYRHWDSIGNTICPMSGERYDMAEAGKRSGHVGHQERRAADRALRFMELIGA